MAKLSQILVINDVQAGLETALHKAAQVEHYTGAEVEVAQVIWDTVEEEPIPEQNKATLIEAFVAAERHGLVRLLEPYRERIAWSEADVLWDKRTATAMLKEAKRTGADLLIKPAAPHTLGDYLHAPLDWQLIRKATCPVLISKSSQWQAKSPVLCAVDVADEAHNALTDAVLITAKLMAEILNAELHIVCVYSDLGQSVNALQVAMDYDGIKADMQQARETALHEILDRLRIEPAQVHIIAGKPAAAIATLEHQLKPSLSVLGTSARSGLKKLFIGNTAEDLIRRLQGDILAVRAFYDWETS